MSREVAIDLPTATNNQFIMKKIIIMFALIFCVMTIKAQSNDLF